MDYSLIDIRTVATEGKGSLSFFEGNRDIPFDIRRIYYIYDTPMGIERGGHAHRSLRQLLWVPFGRIEIVLDDGSSRESVMLDDPSRGLVLEDLVWHEMVWHEEGSVLAVAASEHYDEADYIRDYETFLSELDNRGA